MRKVRSWGYRNSGRNCWTSWTTRTSAAVEAQGRTFPKEKPKGGRRGNTKNIKAIVKASKVGGKGIPQTMRQDGSLQGLNHNKRPDKDILYTVACMNTIEQVRVYNQFKAESHPRHRLGPQRRNTISAACKGISMDSEVTHFTFFHSFESSLCLDLFYMPFSHQNLLNTTLTLEVGSGRLKAMFAKVSAVPSGWTNKIKGIKPEEAGWKEASSTSCRIRKTWHMNWVKMCPKQLLESASEILELVSSLETLWGT